MTIEKMTQRHHDEVLEMMRVFYASPAVLHTSSDRVLEQDISACLCGTSLLDGFIFEEEGKTVGL